MNTDHITTLINALKAHGVSITAEDIPEVQRLGADEYVNRQGIEIKDEDMSLLHMILHEINSIPPRNSNEL